MGCASSKSKDPYSQVLEKYGDEKLKQFIIGVSKVQMIESSKQQIIRIIQDKINTLNSSLINQIESQKMQIDKKYQQSLSRIQKTNPKAIMAAQKVHKQSVKKLMGYEDALKKINEYKQQSKLSMQRQESLAISQLSNFLKQYEAEERQKVPELRKFQALQDDQQQKFIKTAKQKYKSSVQKGLVQVQTVLEDKCNFENFKPKFQTIVSKDKLKQISSTADKMFLAGEQKVKGATDCKTC